MNNPITSTSYGFKPERLFHHLPLHRVVVCTTCRHAVPPKAVARHLKDVHRILRFARNPFVKWVSSFDLSDPADVIPPKDGEFPVAGLPVYMGLRCKWTDCGHLCLSEKRMRSHWLSAHGGMADPDSDHVRVQTFFRGNLLKYFTAASASGDGAGPLNVREEDASRRELDGIQCLSRSTSYTWTLEFLPIQKVASQTTHTKSSLPNTEATALLRHYEASTSLTIAIEGDDELLWRDTVLRLAQEQDFLMLAVLSISSLHLAYLFPNCRRRLIMQASEYHLQAMPLFRRAIAHPDTKNCHAILLFSHLLVLSTFASEQQDENLLLVTSDGDDVLPPWLYLIRNGCSMLCDVWEDIESGPCRELALAWEAPFKIRETHEQSVLDALLAAAPPRSSPRAWSKDVYTEFHEAASALALAFDLSDSSPHMFTTWDVLRIWPMRISEGFICLLKAHHPAALILLAHYSVLLQRTDSRWYCQGRGTILLRTVTRKLDVYWHTFLPDINDQFRDMLSPRFPH